MVGCGLLARTRRMHAPCRRAPCMHRKQLPARRHSACGRANPPQAVDVRSIDASQLGNGMAVLAVALTIRICVTRLALCGSALNRSEAHFVCLAWVPKATVQVRASRVYCQTRLYGRGSHRLHGRRPTRTSVSAHTRLSPCTCFWCPCRAWPARVACVTRLHRVRHTLASRASHACIACVRHLDSS